MYCEKIALNVPHFIGSRVRKDACFVVTIEPGNEHSLINDIGSSYLDSHSIHYFLEWVQNPADRNLYVLATLDLKYLVVSTELSHILPEECQLIPLRDSGRVIANHLQEFKDIIEERASKEPWLYGELKMKLPKLKTRTNFSGWVVLEFDPFGVGQAGLARPATAEISQVCWAYPIAQGFAAYEPDFEYWEFQKELENRLLDQIEMVDSNFDGQGVTISELDRRAESSWKTYLSVQDEWQVLDGWPEDQHFRAWTRRVRDIDDAISIAIIAQFQAKLKGADASDLTKNLSEFFLSIAYQKISDQSSPAGFDPEDY